MDKGIALEYRNDAPRVLFTARGDMLKKMLKIAEERDITVYRDRDLAEVLSVFKPGDSIPESLFSALAAVMSYCYQVNEGFKNKMNESGFLNG